MQIHKNIFHIWLFIWKKINIWGKKKQQKATIKVSDHHSSKSLQLEICKIETWTERASIEMLFCTGVFEWDPHPSTWFIPLWLHWLCLAITFCSKNRPVQQTHLFELLDSTFFTRFCKSSVRKRVKLKYRDWPFHSASRDFNKVVSD